MKAMFMGFVAVVALFVSVLTVQAQDAPKSDSCPAQLQQAQIGLKDNAITENLLESEVNLKRKQVASLGRQLQEERLAHAQTKKALAKLQGAVESTKKAEPSKE